MYEVTRRIEELNQLASRLNGLEHGVFEPASLRKPKLNPAELGFMQVVSYLYVLYYEVGNVGVAFLEDRFEAYGADPDGRLRNHRRVVRQLRTLLQHNLNLLEHRDRAIQENCERWHEAQCGSAIPANEEHWRRCLVGLLVEALEFMGALLRTVRGIEGDESREQMCRDWVYSASRYHPPHVFDELIIKVAIDMGRETIDPVKLRSRFLESWVHELSMLREAHEFEREARRLIEHTILTMAPTLLPITGEDIMTEFGIPPGPRVGDLLESARRIYEREPCGREEFLARLRAAL